MPVGVPQLAAWPLSGKSVDQVAFQQKLHSWSQLCCVPSQHHLMNLSLGNGTAGVWSKDPSKGPIADVVNFLAELFHQGYRYRSLTTDLPFLQSMRKLMGNQWVNIL